jgi:hypothetical protein
MAQDSELARIFFQSMKDREDLPEADQIRFDPLISPTWGYTHQEYHLMREGAVSPTYWQFRLKAMRELLENPGTRQWWREYGGQLSEGFVSIVDGLIRDAETVIREGEAAK